MRLCVLPNPLLPRMIERSLNEYYRCCLFCTNPLTERAREHLFPQWLIDYLGVRDEDVFQGIAQAQDGALLKLTYSCGAKLCRKPASATSATTGG
jgi:hypothetical protein